MQGDDGRVWAILVTVVSDRGRLGNEVERFLRGLSSDELVKLLLDHAESNAGLAARLQMAAAAAMVATPVATKAGPSQAEVANLKSALERMVVPYDYVPYRATYGWSTIASEGLGVPAGIGRRGKLRGGDRTSGPSFE